MPCCSGGSSNRWRRSHGFAASFMAKPYLDRAGSGMHVHCSLVDAKGRNVFDDGGEKGTALLRHAIGGLAATTAEAMALLAPNLNSYRRYRPGSLVPMAHDLGLQQPLGRLSRADRLAQGAAHRAPHRRRRRQSLSRGRRDPGRHAAWHREANSIPARRRPRTSAARSTAICRSTGTKRSTTLRKAKILPAYIDPGYLALYADAKEAEMHKFNRAISPQEHEWYL